MGSFPFVMGSRPTVFREANVLDSETILIKHWSCMSFGVSLVRWHYFKNLIECLQQIGHL